MCPLLFQPGLNVSFIIPARTKCVLYYSSKDCPLLSQPGPCPTLMSTAFGHRLSVKVVLLQCNDETWTWLISHWCALTWGKANSVFSLSQWQICELAFVLISSPLRNTVQSINHRQGGVYAVLLVPTAWCVLSSLNQGSDRWLHNTGCCVLSSLNQGSDRWLHNTGCCATLALGSWQMATNYSLLCAEGSDRWLLTTACCVLRDLTDGY